MRHPALMQSSGWNYSSRLRDLKAAKDWGINPKEFDELPKFYRLEIIAVYEASWRIDSINNYEVNKKAEAAAAAKSRKGRRK